ncbi:MAG TPA: hypothetical protein VF458_05640 [Ktedonobacteraceae bacterium]
MLRYLKALDEGDVTLFVRILTLVIFDEELGELIEGVTEEMLKDAGRQPPG